MHIKFLARGTGSAREAADYLLGARDATGQLREGVEVLQGDPHRVAAVADALAFEHKYTSGVIAWAPDDTPTDAQIGAVIDAFEQTAWAGLEPDRYAWAAVVHRERDGGVHVHVLAARCDLETGRSLNIAPPGWQKTFDPLRDAFNAEEGWSRPDDPARARVQQPGHRAYVEAAHLRAGLALEPAPRDLIRDYLLQRVEHGTVRNRADIVAALREAGLEVPRQGQDYLTALDPTTGDRWRLKGELYAHDFQRERLDRAIAETAGERTPGDRGVDDERARAARRELAARCEQRAAYHRSRYGGRDRSDARALAQGLAPAPGRRPEPLARHLRRELGDDALAVGAHPGPARGDHLGDHASGDRGGAVRGAAGRRARLSALDRGQSAGSEAVEQVRELYDRVRTAIDEGLADVVRAVRAGAAAARRAGRDLAAAGRSLGAAGRAAKRASDILGPGLQDARRDVTRALELMRHRGRERDHGPSR